MKELSGFKKGVNLGGWLSQCDYSRERLEGFITEDDIIRIAMWGADHVRIPFDYNIITDSSGNINGDGFRYLDRALEWCEKYGLNAILDLHKTKGFSFDTYAENESGLFSDDTHQEFFCSLWEMIARRYSPLGDRVAFELLNEVTDRAFIEDWNDLADRCISRIRAIAPRTVIIIGGCENNSALTVKYLRRPHDDRVVYNMHCYEPLRFTHQGAYWTEVIDPDKRLSFEDSGTDTDYFRNLFKEAYDWARTNDTVLYCGEYGVINIASPEDTVKWFRTINSVFEEFGIGRAVWTYKEMDFGITDSHLSSVFNELVKYL